MMDDVLQAQDEERRPQAFPRSDALQAMVLWRRVAITAGHPLTYRVCGPCLFGGIRVYNGGVNGVTSIYDWHDENGLADWQLIGRTDTAGAMVQPRAGGIRCQDGLIVVRPALGVVAVVDYAIEVGAGVGVG